MVGTELRTRLMPSLGLFLAGYPQYVCQGSYSDAVKKLSVTVPVDSEKNDRYLRGQLKVTHALLNSIIRFLNHWLGERFVLDCPFECYHGGGKHPLYAAISGFINPVSAIKVAETLTAYRIPHRIIISHSRQLTHLVIEDILSPMMTTIKAAKREMEADESVGGLRFR